MIKFASLTAALFLSSASLAGVVHHSFDTHFVESEKETCSQKKSPGEIQTWLLGELKSLSDVAPVISPAKSGDWSVDLQTFTVNGVTVPAQWVRGSPGTFGSVDGHTLKTANDKTGKILEGPVVSDGDVKGKFWLVEKTATFPDLTALNWEAKKVGALGLILYSEGTAGPSEDGTEGVGATDSVPMIWISKTAADNLREDIKKGTAQAALSLKTDFPAAENKSDIFIKFGARDPSLFVSASFDDCSRIAWSLGIINWLKTSEAQTQGAVFGFLASADDVDVTAPPSLGKYLIPFPEKPDIGSGQIFLKNWVKADQEPQSLLKIKNVIQETLKMSSHLRGLVDGNVLRKFSDGLKNLKFGTSVEALTKELEIQKLLEPTGGAGSGRILGLADRIRALQQIHDLAQKGMWDEAVTDAKKLEDFQWADQVSPSLFLDYNKRLFLENDTRVDPSVWAELQKGKSNLDASLPVLENEIDRLNGKLTDNFFRLQKNLEDLQKI